MKLSALRLRNFKGAESVKVEPRGSDITIYGDNAVGKTTIADALYWLLFGKDSLNRADFDIKTRDAQGRELHNLEHEVEGDFSLDGSAIKLRKVYHETWQRKRGNLEAEHTGHTIDYFVNTVPVQKKDYDDQIKGICDEKRFRLLTDPTYFNTQLHWQDRRKALIDICGDVTDADVIGSSFELSELPSLLGTHSLDNFRKILTSRKREINEEIQKIPVRADEAKRLAGTSVPGAVEDLNALREELNSLQERRAAVNSGGEIADKQAEIQRINAEMIEAENRLKAEASKAYDRVSAEYRAKNQEAETARQEMARKEGQIKSAEQMIQGFAKTREELRAKFLEESAKTFEFTGVDSCAACGQALPSERVQAARDMAEGNFNEAKARMLEDIQTRGREARQKQEELEARTETARAELEQLRTRVEALDNEAAAAKAQRDSTQIGEVDVTKSAYWTELRTKKQTLEREVEAIRSGQTNSLEHINQMIAVVNGRIQAGTEASAKRKQIEDAKKRIEELGDEQKKLAAEFEELQRQFELTELFIRAKVRLLTERINARFELATFTLFEEQINGGLVECCEAMYGGVPFGGLNHGSQVNVGLDIIRTLQNHYGFHPPVVIDGAESITRFIPMDCQVIKLVVSEPDKSLRFEIHEQKELLTA